MHLPPGPVYLARLLPYFLIPSGAVCGTLKLSNQHLSAGVPTWGIITATALARPVLFILGKYYARYANRRGAAALGAEIMPHVEEKWPRFGGFSIIATMLESVKNGYPGDALLEWTKKYGNTFELRLPTDSRIITFEPDYVKSILATQFEDFDKGSVFIFQMNSLLGTGVFNSDGEMWKFHRSMTRPFFTRERISDFDIFDAHADDALKQAKERLAEGNPIDFQDLVSRFTLDSATKFLFGNNVQSLSAGLPYAASSQKANSETFLNHPSTVFVDAFVSGQNKCASRTRLGPNWPLGEFWEDKVLPHREVVDRFLEPLLEGVLAQKKLEGDIAGDKAEGLEEEVNLLQHLVNHTQDGTILKDELLNLLVAARDTTASTLTFAFYMLAEHPEIADRLRNEIIAKLGITNRPTYDDMRELKYLRAFINEVLRLYPAVPFDSRTSNKATVWRSKAPGAKAYYIPANTRILYSVFFIHRRTDLWGPDALEFDPDRFLDERLHKYLTPNPFIFCPFNAGPRICLGQQFAYHEASFFLIRLLQQFTGFSLAPEAQPAGTTPPKSWADCEGLKAKEKICPGLHLTMYVKGGLWVRMRELKHEVA